MNQLDNTILKQALVTYMDLEMSASRLTDYRGAKVLCDAIEGLKTLLEQQGVINVDADCDGSVTSVNPDFE